MSALSKLGLGDYPGDTNLYDWFLSKFKSNNFGAEIVTYSLVTELKGYLHLKKNQHDAKTPPNALSRQQLCHLIIYLVLHIPIPIPIYIFVYLCILCICVFVFLYLRV